jgi:hypothetical protein
MVAPPFLSQIHRSAWRNGLEVRMGSWVAACKMPICGQEAFS